MDDRERVASMWQIERQLKKNGCARIAGVDEAGRGPLAGPVCVAAVILPDGLYLEKINDSKKLTPRQREKLYDQIIEQAACYSIVEVSPAQIDQMNILNATFYGMCQAVSKLSIRPDHVLIDGNQIRGMELPHTCVVKGDSKSISIAAASILAKVTRDRLMEQLDRAYPQYGFAKHKGYPTKAHYEALLKYGPCPEHRRSFRLT
jgi:ribonuclease HII